MERVQVQADGADPGALRNPGCDLDGDGLAGENGFGAIRLFGDAQKGRRVVRRTPHARLERAQVVDFAHVHIARAQVVVFGAAHVGDLGRPGGGGHQGAAQIHPVRQDGRQDSEPQVNGRREAIHRVVEKIVPIVVGRDAIGRGRGIGRGKDGCRQPPTRKWIKMATLNV